MKKVSNVEMVTKKKKIYKEQDSKHYLKNGHLKFFENYKSKF